ncbi:MAG TPA: biosynthetic peptidoglycan transglycosylase [Pyrinomonadaceae bacterium]|nr:biosynthetic peptidoglycan transglycosylase [Pyrinomonadaceae bacterium]
MPIPFKEIKRLGRENPADTSFMRYTAARAGRATKEIRDWWPLVRVAPLLPCAIVKAEDFCFARHGGVAWMPTLLMVVAAMRTGRTVPGGSTITQQLARNLFLTPERKLSRKFREVVCALALERALDKARILELYLNTVEWADGVWGCAAASAHYLSKTPDRLDAFESIVLSTLLPAPRCPLAGDNLARAYAAQQRVAWQLYLSGVLSKTETCNCLARAARLRELLARGASLREAFAAERASGALNSEASFLPFTRHNDEPLAPRDAVASAGFGFERERFELIELRRRLGAKRWQEAVVSGGFFRAAPKATEAALPEQQSV